MGIHATLAATVTTTIIESVSAIADVASATTISSAAVAWSFPEVHHRVQIRKT